MQKTFRSTALTLLALVSSTAALAQTPAKPAAKPAAKAPARPAAKKKVEPPPPPPLVLPEATEEQIAAQERAYLGQYDCEFKQYINITRDAKHPGYIEVSWKNQVFTMKPVLSSTGALRLEDVTGRTLMIQIANKSMLMDTKIGQRLVDDCIHPTQREAIEAARLAKAAAAASGIAPEPGLGIEVRAPHTPAAPVVAPAAAPVAAPVAAPAATPTPTASAPAMPAPVASAASAVSAAASVPAPSAASAASR